MQERDDSRDFLDARNCGCQMFAPTFCSITLMTQNGGRATHSVEFKSQQLLTCPPPKIVPKVPQYQIVIQRTICQC